MARTAAKVESDSETRAKTHDPSACIQMKPLGYFKHLFCYITLGMLNCYMPRIVNTFNNFRNMLSARIIMRMVLFFAHFISPVDISINRGVSCREGYFDYSNCVYFHTS